MSKVGFVVCGRVEEKVKVLSAVLQTQAGVRAMCDLCRKHGYADAWIADAQDPTHAELEFDNQGEVMAGNRMYIVEVNAEALKITGAKAPVRLVKASHPAAAERYVMARAVQARYAEQEELVELLRKGVVVEEVAE